MTWLEKMRNGIKKGFQKIKEIDFKKLVNNKIAITCGSILLLGAVVLSVAIISSKAGDAKEAMGNESRRSLGQSVLANGDVSNVDTEVDSKDYFTVAAMTRESVREEAMHVLQSIVDSPDVMPDAKDQAMADLQALAKEMAKEVNIETLIKAKGITNVLAVLSGEKCNIIVKSETKLTQANVAQISEIVYLETGIHPKTVRIIETKEVEDTEG